MTDEATQQGVSEGFGSNRLKQINAIHEDRVSEREEDVTPEDDAEAEDALAVIQKRGEDLDDELRQLDANGGEEPEDDSAEDEDDSTEQQAADNTGQDDDQDSDEPESPLFMEGGQWMTRVKVDGEVKTIPFDRLQAAAQKLEAGDKRLEKANRMQREIEERERRVREQEAQRQTEQLPAEGAEGQTGPESGQSEDVKELASKYHQALLNGEDDEVTNDLLTRLATANRQQQPEVDVNRITQEVESRVAERQQQQDQERQQAEYQAQIQTAYESFKEDFSDVANDPQLMQVADQFTVTVANENPTLSPLQVMKEAGKRTRQWLNEKSGTTDTQKRTNRKRGLKTASGSGARQPGKPEPKPKTRTDQINEIRQARGQMPLGQ